MNWFKTSQFEQNEVGAVIYSMLIDAGRNPSKPIEVSIRLQGTMPDTIAQGLDYAYNRIVNEFGGMLNENQQKVVMDTRAMIENVPGNPIQLPLPQGEGIDPKINETLPDNTEVSEQESPPENQESSAVST